MFRHLRFCRPEGMRGPVGVGGLCHTERVLAMSAPSLADRLALVAADPALVGYPVVAGLVAVVGELESELVSLREENAELRRQLGRHSGNSGQPPSQDGPSAPPRPRSRRRSRGRTPGGQPGHAGATRRQAAGCPRMEALAAYLRYVQHLPTGRLRALLRALHGVMLSTGTVEALCRRVAGRLATRADPLRQQALTLPVAGMDETGLRVAGETLWLHVLCDDHLTFYRLGARGDIWVEYAGTAVHNRFASYLSPLPEETAHALCNAHLLRNLEAIVEREQAPDGWAALLQRLLLKARDTAAYWRDTTGGPVPEPVREQTAAVWDTSCSRCSTTMKACLRPPADAAAATTWPWPCGCFGTPVCSSWPTPPCPLPTTGRSRPCAWPSCQ